MQYDVFISYARKDYADEQTKEVIPGNIVSRIKQLLDDNGLTYWFDETGIYSGDQFAGVIADAIEQSAVFLYISTEASNASKWTINEIATAKHLDKKIIPFRCDGAKYNKSILMYLAPLDHIDYPKSKDKAFGQLIASIKTYKQTQERAEQERLRAIELAKRREQEALEKQKQELEKQVRIREINQQLETLSSEIQKKKQEQASINIVLEGLEKRRTNLNNELAFLTGMATSYHPIEEEEEKVPDVDNAITRENENEKERSSVSFAEVWNKCKSFTFRNKLTLGVSFVVLLIVVILGVIGARELTPEEMYRKASVYYNNGGGANHFAKAVKWYRKAADLGYADAQFSLGDCYYNGIGVFSDSVQAVEWYRKAAERGHADAQYRLGVCLYDAEELTQAVEWYRKAAEQGHADAQHRLGNCYYHALGVEQDYIQAVKWYRKAAEQGEIHAQFCLGNCYYEGHGVTLDYDKAIECYRKIEGTREFASMAKELIRMAEVRDAYIVNGVSFTMVAVKGGTFTMGATSEQTGADSDESPTHQVTLSDYYIGETEVTQELWQAVMGSNPSYFTGNLQRPVEKVSWDDCQTFIAKLNALTGKTFSLPTEAEWEYAARGGNKAQGYLYSGSNTIGDVAWYTSNSSSTTHPVKTKQANELGIYDMSGNVWEWCADCYGSYSSSAQTDPEGSSSGSYRVLRGGSWSNNATYCRVANPHYDAPSYTSSDSGLRLSL